MSTPDVNSFLMGGGAPAAKFPDIGTTIEGRILDTEVTQQTDLDGNPKVWENNGKPMMQAVVTLQTDLRDPEIGDDDGIRRLFVKGQMQTAVRDAVKAAGARELKHGGTLKVQYHADGERKKAGYNAPKLYRAKYTAPAISLVDDWGGDDEAAEAPAMAAAPAASVPSIDEF